MPGLKDELDEIESEEISNAVSDRKSAAAPIENIERKFMALSTFIQAPHLITACVINGTYYS